MSYLVQNRWCIKTNTADEFAWPCHEALAQHRPHIDTMPSLSTLEYLGAAHVPQLNIKLSTHLLHLDHLAHLNPQEETKNLVYVYSNLNPPGDTQLYTKSGEPARKVFPPAYIHTAHLGNLGRAQAGDIFMWMSDTGRSATVVQCWILERIDIPPVKVSRTSGRKTAPPGLIWDFKWIRVDVRKAMIRHPLHRNHQLALNAEEYVGSELVQLFAIR